VVSKAGKKTYGLDRFFSSIVQRPIPGVAFFSFALISTSSRRAFPLCIEQVVRTDAEKAASKAKTAKLSEQSIPKRKVGRPKGSKNKRKSEHSLSPELQRIQCILHDILSLSVGTLPLMYLALDGHFGTAPAIQMVRGSGLHIISKLRSNAALFLPYDGPYQGRGPRRRYGEKLDLKALPARFLRETRVEDGIETCIYQVEALQKEVAEPLNVVVMVKTNLRTRKRAHVVLFSSDMTLRYDRVIDFYSLRFQIEFTFRDGKQYWGLEDFMTVTASGVRNAANVALFMVSVSAVLLREEREEGPECSVLDLKAKYRGTKYVLETIQLLPGTVEKDLIVRIVRQVAGLGRIHPLNEPLKAA
jgi:putative transposase